MTGGFPNKMEPSQNGNISYGYVSAHVTQNYVKIRQCFIIRSKNSINNGVFWEHDQSIFYQPKPHKFLTFVVWTILAMDSPIVLVFKTPNFTGLSMAKTRWDQPVLALVIFPETFYFACIIKQMSSNMLSLNHSKTKIFNHLIHMSPEVCVCLSLLFPCLKTSLLSLNLVFSHSWSLWHSQYTWSPNCQNHCYSSLFILALTTASRSSSIFRLIN